MTLTFTYTGGDGHDVTIQWFHNSVLLEDGGGVSGATTTTLTIPDTEEYNGEYYAVVTDNDVVCSVTTDTVDVTVPASCELEITTQPESQEVLEGDELELTVAYSGEIGPVTFQWYLDGNPLTDGVVDGATISGATTATLTITDMATSLAGDYTVVVTDTGIMDCVVESDAAAVTVATCDIIIAEQPVNTPYEDGETIALSVVASGGVGPYTYQWYQNGVALVDGPGVGDPIVSGATTADLTITDADSSYAGAYTVVITDTGVPGECSVTSDSVNVYMLLLIEDFEGANPPIPDCYDLADWGPESSVGGDLTANTSTPICGTCSLRTLGGTLGQETDTKHAVIEPQTKAWIHIRVRVNTTLPVNDNVVLRLGANGDTTPASGELRVILLSEANGHAIQVASPGAVSASTIAIYHEDVAYHIWAYYDSTTGEGWVKFSSDGIEPELGSDNSASYTGGSTDTVDHIFIGSQDTELFDFDTIRWANFNIGDMGC